MTTPAVGIPLLELDDLSVAFGLGRRRLQVLDSVSLSVRPGETVGLVGESGSGKTVTALSAMGLIGGMGGQLLSGAIRLAGRDLTDISERAWMKVRGREVAMIFQQPTRSLDPVFTVGSQLAETARRHLGLSHADSWRRGIEMLDLVRIHNPTARVNSFPFELSGGMCQRVMIAMALIGGPKVLIADEPTTALDVTVQADILRLLREVQIETGVAILFVSHDLGVIGQICDRINVFYAGQVIEEGSVGSVLGAPRHPYTAALLACVPRRGTGLPNSIPGLMPDFSCIPRGCRFHLRCEHNEMGRCDVNQQALLVCDNGLVRCERHVEIARSEEAAG